METSTGVSLKVRRSPVWLQRQSGSQARKRLATRLAGNEAYSNIFLMLSKPI